MKWIYDVFEAPGAAIPSSHVAIAITTCFFSFRYLRAIRWVHLVMVVLLCLATVYCRYHYLCDVFAGVLTALLLIPAGNWLHFRFINSTEEYSQAHNLPAPPSASASTPPRDP